MGVRIAEPESVGARAPTRGDGAGGIDARRSRRLIAGRTPELAHRHSRVALLVIAAMMFVASPASAQDGPPPRQLPTLPNPPSPKARKPSPAPSTPPAAASGGDAEKASELATESAKAFMAGDIDKAESLLNEQLKLQPKNFVIFYNLACCRAMK